MTVELKNTVGYDFGIRSGKGNAIRALTNNPQAREVAILQGFAQLVNEAGFNGATVKEQLPIARMVGYVEALATAVGLAQACGVTFSTTLKSDGTQGLAAHIDFPKPRALEAQSTKY